MRTLARDPLGPAIGRSAKDMRRVLSGVRRRPRRRFGRFAGDSTAES